MKGFNWFMMHANDLYNVSNVLWVARALKSPEIFLFRCGPLFSRHFLLDSYATLWQWSYHNQRKIWPSLCCLFMLEIPAFLFSFWSLKWAIKVLKVVILQTTYSWPIFKSCLEHLFRHVFFCRCQRSRRISTEQLLLLKEGKEKESFNLQCKSQSFASFVELTLTKLILNSLFRNDDWWR